MFHVFLCKQSQIYAGNKQTQTITTSKKLNPYFYYIVFSSVESLLEEHDKENEARLKRRRKKKGQSKAPHTWYNYLENKKMEEAQERKNARRTFLHIVEGEKSALKSLDAWF